MTRVRNLLPLAALLFALVTPAGALADETATDERTGLAALASGDWRTGIELLRRADDAGKLTPRGHYRLASALGNLRARGEVCEVGAFRGEIVRHLTLATTGDTSLLGRARNDFAFAGVRDTVGYQALLGRLASRESDAPELLARVRWWGAGIATIGSAASLRLERGGRATLSRTMMAPGGAVEKRVETGKWSLKGRELSLDLPKNAMSGRLLETGVLVIDGLGELRDEPAECGEFP